MVELWGLSGPKNWGPPQPRLLVALAGAPSGLGASPPRLSSAYISQDRPSRRRLSAQTARWELPLLCATAEVCRRNSRVKMPSIASNSVMEKAADGICRPAQSSRELPESREVFLIETRFGGQKFNAALISGRW